ncbi:copper resistance protein NlpE [Chryseobacterium sp. HR92]|uniref:copper resistance protein NlpE n=1 Tax=Chryseobacterium sp. HR92 TaxID=3094839 RepID=UPI00388E88DC|nr:copper resistance protein NlpE [Chryseobacterium sp. HR92]
MKQIQILGFAAIALLASCSKATKQEVSTSTTDSTAIQATAEPVSADSAVTAVKDSHNSKTSLNWNGTYEATLPCADCQGIKTTITLNKDNTFNYEDKYIVAAGKPKNENKDKGTFEWDAEGSVITLKGKEVKGKYKVGENKLIALDLEGKEIDGPNKDFYIFKKK